GTSEEMEDGLLGVFARGSPSLGRRRAGACQQSCHWLLQCGDGETGTGRLWARPPSWVKEVSPLWIHLTHHFRIIVFALTGLLSGSCVQCRTRAFGIASYGRRRCAPRRASASISPKAPGASRAQIKPERTPSLAASSWKRLRRSKSRTNRVMLAAKPSCA